jgi:hypothetical protein
VFLGCQGFLLNQENLDILDYLVFLGCLQCLGCLVILENLGIRLSLDIHRCPVYLVVLLSLRSEEHTSQLQSHLNIS